MLIARLTLVTMAADSGVLLGMILAASFDIHDAPHFLSVATSQTSRNRTQVGYHWYLESKVRGINHEEHLLSETLKKQVLHYVQDDKIYDKNF
jgi:hypothetical protein